MPSSTKNLVGTVALLGLGTFAWAGAGPTPLVRAGGSLPESSLLDVHITVFEPAEGFFPEVRDAEARYIPVELKHVFEETGFWGAVRVVPDSGHTDVTIGGAVLRSHGGRLELEIRAADATGKVWVDKKYKSDADVSEYLDPESLVDPFRDVYHRIANDVSKRYRKLDREDLESIRDTSRLRFASELAPDAFADYLSARKKRYVVSRLPARDDPMMERVDRIRIRDAVFLDTVDSYYQRLFDRMIDSYHGWRSQDYWQRQAMKNGPPTPQRKGGRNAPLGVLTVTGNGRRWPGDTRVCWTADGGAGPCEDVRRPEPEVEDEWEETHLDIIRELGSSLAADVEPLLVDVEGRVSALTGSMEAQYTQWRALMKEIFAAETGGVH